MEACRRWPDASDKSLGHYLSKRYPAFFKSDESGRDSVRYFRGHIGKEKRTRKNGGIFERVDMPESLSREKPDWYFTDGKWLTMGDLHVPFHDPVAIERTFADAKKHGVNGVLICGDLHDCEGVGFFFNPELRRDFAGEVEIMIDFLDYLRGKFPKFPIVWMPGNHEERLETYYARNAPDIADLPTADMATILGTGKRGIEMLDRRQKAICRAKEEAGNLHVLHGHTLLRGMSMTVSPARTIILKSKANCVIFHVHRNSYQPEQTISYRGLASWSVGCLCGLRPDYNCDANNWSQGHGILEVNGTDWEFTLRRHLRDGRIVGGM